MRLYNLLQILSFPTPERKKLALRGVISHSIIFTVIIITLFISYFTQFIFEYIKYFGCVSSVIDFGLKFVPEISKGMALASEPEKCGFVLTVQWLMSVLYVYIFFVIYCPSTKIMRVTVHRWYRFNPRQSFTSARAVGVMVLAILFILGDFGVIGMPTPYNGGLLHHVSGGDLVLSLINSPFLFPIFAWITVIFQVVIYWSIFYIISNYRLVFKGFSLDA